MTPQEKAFTGHYARTGDPVYSAAMAGYKQPIQRSHHNLQKPAVNAEIRALQIARLHNEGVPLALDLLITQIGDESLAPQHRQGAAKIVLNTAKDYSDALGGKSVADMAPDELKAAIRRVEQMLGKADAEDAQLVEQQPAGDVFD